MLLHYQIFICLKWSNSGGARCVKKLNNIYLI